MCDTKDTKKRVITEGFKLKDYRRCVKATQLENEISHLENNKLDEII